MLTGSLVFVKCREGPEVVGFAFNAGPRDKEAGSAVSFLDFKPNGLASSGEKPRRSGRH